MKKKIFFITTCRADYGYIEELLNEASKSLNHFSIYLIISGNHFSKFFGNSHIFDAAEQVIINACNILKKSLGTE